MPHESNKMFDTKEHPYLNFTAYIWKNLCEQLYWKQNMYKRYVDMLISIMSTNKFKLFMQGIIYFFLYKDGCFYHVFQ
jgi:hypothetical protein